MPVDVRPLARRPRWRRWGTLILAAVLASAAGYLLHIAFWRPLALVGTVPVDGYHRLAGVVHVHTSLSDGGGSPQEVIAAARASGLGFVAITDHNNLDAKPFEGYRDGVLVLVGSELSTPSAGHVLGLGLERDPVYRFNGDAQDALEDVRDLGGVAFAAHPFSRRSDLRWSGWGLAGPWGIELLNGDSEWRQAGPRLLALGLYQLNPGYALLQSLVPPDEELRRWDEILRRRDAVGIAGADAHSRLPISRRLVLRFPSYQALFGLFRDHLLLAHAPSGDAAADRSAVVDAIRRGRLYIGLDALASADDFSFTVDRADGERFTMGDSVPPAAGMRARAGGRVPKGTRLVLFRDGGVAAEAVETLDVPLPGPGVYRLEARVPGWRVPWVITNPIAVIDAATRARRSAAAAWATPPRPRAVRSLASFPGGAAFHPESDPASWLDASSPSPEATGPGGTPALKLAFRLAEPTQAQPFTWCALVDRQARDLRGYAGLRFWIKGDDEYRIWVQVRDVNAAAADGLEGWLASARTSREWRLVLLPFSRFRTIDRHTDGILDLADIRAVVFMLDGASVKVGTRGTIWIADPGVYQ